MPYICFFLLGKITCSFSLPCYEYPVYLFIYTPQKRKSALIWRVTISNLVIYGLVTSLFQTFVGFSHLQLDTLFAFTEHEVSTFDTDLWKMMQSEKLQVAKRSRQGNLQSVSTTHARDHPYWSLHRGPVKLAQVIQLYWSLHCVQVNSARPGLFYCSVHGNVTVNYF